MNTKLVTLTAAALVAAPMAFANGVTGGTITAIDNAAHTITLSGAKYAVANRVDLASWQVGQRVHAYVNDHGDRTVQRLFQTN